MKPIPVLVKWVDPEFVGGWHDKKDVKASMKPIYSIGYLIHQDSDMYVIASTVNVRGKEKTFADVSKFPRGCVLQIKEIEMEE
jgi:hypothetical protein